MTGVQTCALPIYFSQFVNYFRVRYGAELLRKDPSLRLISVAQMCGFHSSPSFNTAFKVNMGVTPSVFQERLRHEKFEKELNPQSPSRSQERER